MSRSIVLQAIRFLMAMFLLAAVLMILMFDSGAEVGGPVGGMTSPSGWIVESGDDLTYSDETILLNGDLIIQSGGKLTFEGIDIYSNARGDKNATIRIHVEEGGTFIVMESLLSSRFEVDQYQGNQPWRYKFQVYGTLNITGSTVEYMWGDLEGIVITDVFGSMHSTNTGGIEIWSDDVFIQDCTITRGQTCGLNIWEGSPTICDTSFIENDMMGVSVLDGDSSAELTGCSFNNNGGNGVTLHANYLDFSDNEMLDNGGSGFFIINSQNVSFEGLDIRGNSRGLHVVLCDATFINSTIVDNGVTMAITNEGSVLLQNTECDITGEDMDLHEDCWVAYTVPVDVRVLDEGDPVANAKVKIEGSEGNLTWTRSYRTNSEGKTWTHPALMVRNGELWYNLSEYFLEAHVGTDSGNHTENITGPTEITIILALSANSDQNNPSDVEEGGDDGSNDVEYHQVFGVVSALIVVVIVVVVYRKRGRNGDVDDGEGEYLDPRNVEWDEAE